jgi:N6-adenosine-specific RNA methylase IME4
MRQQQSPTTWTDDPKAPEESADAAVDGIVQTELPFSVQPLENVAGAEPAARSNQTCESPIDGLEHRAPMNDNRDTVIDAALDFTRFVGARKFKTILADPPWQFQNRTGKIAPEHKRLSRYGTMRLDDIKSLPVENASAETSHLYLWVPNALLPEGLSVMAAWGFNYKSNIVWQKIRKDGGPDGRGVGFYFRNVTELLLFGVRGKNARTLQPGRTQVNIMSTRKREHSRKPDERTT